MVSFLEDEQLIHTILIIKVTMEGVRKEDLENIRIEETEEFLSKVPIQKWLLFVLVFNGE
jgi:hypothetical protein